MDVPDWNVIVPEFWGALCQASGASTGPCILKSDRCWSRDGLGDIFLELGQFYISVISSSHCFLLYKDAAGSVPVGMTQRPTLGSWGGSACRFFDPLLLCTNMYISRMVHADCAPPLPQRRTCTLNATHRRSYVCLTQFVPQRSRAFWCSSPVRRPQCRPQ